MKDNFDTPEAGDAASANLPEDSDELEITDLPPDKPGHYLLAGLTHKKQRLLSTVKDVSRATWQANDSQALEHPAQADSGEFELEISELPPTLRSHYLLLRLKRLYAACAGVKRAPGGTPGGTATPLPAYRPRRYVGRVLMTFSMCAALLLVLLISVPGLSSRLVGYFAPALTATTVSHGSVSISTIDTNVPVIVHPFGTPPSSTSQNSPGAIPSTCPQLSTLQYFTSPLDPPGLGSGPVWLSGFSGPGAVLDHLTHISKTGEQVWYETLALFMQKGFNGDIILQGNTQDNDGTLLFSRNEARTLYTSLIFNLNDSNHYLTPTPQWEMTSVVIAVPTAGCYSLRAVWSNSSWQRYFAAGA
ncbi:MAG TPA: hypothetical protein VGD98_06205 [Ktedonobacteraceae bacterium]